MRTPVNHIWRDLDGFPGLVSERRVVCELERVYGSSEGQKQSEWNCNVHEI